MNWALSMFVVAHLACNAGRILLSRAATCTAALTGAKQTKQAAQGWHLVLHICGLGGPGHAQEPSGLTRCARGPFP